ncbi:MAG TPA: chemotaxis-specific protein-glutamate methyltransferase CheB [Polyangiaceae bacterium]|nr:chemotaxis-specific protein-glutamate methyltransferase CheB [Polyangiaceae bacterium]
MTQPIRVLIVDDSAFTRKVLREMLSLAPDIQVVGTARDGLEALEKMVELSPDVITLDLVMPNLDGLGVLDSLPVENAPRVIVVSISDADTELGAAALQAGALDIVRKPTALATQQLYELSSELLQKVRLAAAARSPRPLLAAPPSAHARAAPRHDVIVLGTSTGGPQALTRLLAALPGDLPAPLLIALHIPAGYTEALAARLDNLSALEVREASPGLEPRAGMAVLARGGAHLQLVGAGSRQELALDHRLDTTLHAPSVDLLFESAVALHGARTLGVVLTGMGDDGLKGARAIRAAGGTVLTESELSCVVYGMPRCVKEAGLSSGEASIEMMADAIVRFL